MLAGYLKLQAAIFKSSGSIIKSGLFFLKLRQSFLTVRLIMIHFPS